jgi:hypothetical protein
MADEIKNMLPYSLVVFDQSGEKEIVRIDQDYDLEFGNFKYLPDEMPDIPGKQEREYPVAGWSVIVSAQSLYRPPLPQDERFVYLLVPMWVMLVYPERFDLIAPYNVQWHDEANDVKRCNRLVFKEYHYPY